MLLQKNRLKGSSNFKRVRKLGKTFRHPLIILIAAPNQIYATRVGIVVGRAVGNAVQRNQVKRRIRACVRQILSSDDGGWDIILIARKPAGMSCFNDIEKALADLFNRAVKSASLDDR